MNISRSSNFALYGFLAIALFQCIALFASENIPANYNDAKAKLDQLTNPIDLPTAESESARDYLRLHADEMNLALQFLFKENTGNRYRTSIMSLLANTMQYKNQTITFVNAQLDSLPEREIGRMWVIIGLKFLSQNAPEKAALISRKWLNGSSPDLQLIGINTLEEVGMDADIVALETFLHSPASVPQRDPYCEKAAKEAIPKLRQRLSQ